MVNSLGYALGPYSRNCFHGLETSKYPFDTPDGCQGHTDLDCFVACAETSLTQTNSMLGSVHYLSPEHAWFEGDCAEWYLCHGDYFLWDVDRPHIPYDGDSAVLIALQFPVKPLPRYCWKSICIPQVRKCVIIKATEKVDQSLPLSVSEMYVLLSSIVLQS